MVTISITDNITKELTPVMCVRCLLSRNWSSRKMNGKDRGRWRERLSQGWNVQTADKIRK